MVKTLRFLTACRVLIWVDVLWRVVSRLSRGAFLRSGGHAGQGDKIMWSRDVLIGFRATSVSVDKCLSICFSVWLCPERGRVGTCHGAASNRRQDGNKLTWRWPHWQLPIHNVTLLNTVEEHARGPLERYVRWVTY